MSDAEKVLMTPGNHSRWQASFPARRNPIAKVAVVRIVVPGAQISGAVIDREIGGTARAASGEIAHARRRISEEIHRRIIVRRHN